MTNSVRGLGRIKGGRRLIARVSVAVGYPGFVCDGAGIRCLNTSGLRSYTRQPRCRHHPRRDVSQRSQLVEPPGARSTCSVTFPVITSL